MYVILDNIRSVHNVGSIFRTCDGAGVEKIFLCGVTPAPIDRFGRVRKDFAKVSLGAQHSVSWEHVASTREAIERLKKEGVHAIAVEQDARATPFLTFFKNSDISRMNRTAFVFGEETEGLSKEILDTCDGVIEIPMRGEKESLNVSVAAGIILFCVR